MTAGDFEEEYTVEISEPSAEGEGVTIEDFRAYMPMPSAFIFLPCCEIWPGSNVNARLPPMPVLDAHGQPKQHKGKIVTIPASQWLVQNRPVEQMTWAPGLPKLIADRLVVDGGWVERNGVVCFNLYRPPRVKPGDATKAGPWVKHINKVFDAPGDAAHLINWLAHRVQYPQDKVNHALVMGGAQGIGKDTILAPIKYAVGPWNFHEVSPTHLLGRFNGFVKSVVLRVNEARDLGDAERINRFSFYEHTKLYTAAPPDVLRADEKYLREYYVFNCMGFILTTNHKTDGIFLPPDDRRHYVAWSDRTREEFSKEYWNELWGWYDEGGREHVAAYLAALDLSGFDPKAPPSKTHAFWDIVDASSSPEDAELADVIDAMGNPDALTPKQLIAKASGDTLEWLEERKNRRAIPHRLERCGYTSVRNPNANDGRWKIAGARQPIYAKNTLSVGDRARAAYRLTT
jgi:uncharacterized protein DUF5906